MAAVERNSLSYQHVNLSWWAMKWESGFSSLVVVKLVWVRCKRSVAV